MWDFPGSEIQPMSPALEDKFFTVETLGKPSFFVLFLLMLHMFWVEKKSINLVKKETEVMNSFNYDLMAFCSTYLRTASVKNTLWLDVFI